MELILERKKKLLRDPNRAEIYICREWSKKEKILSMQQFCWWKCLVDAGGQKSISRLVWAELKGNSDSNMHKSNLEADGLQWQKTTPGFTPVSREQETDATVYTGSLKLDNRRLEKGCLVRRVTISASTFGWLSQNLALKAWKHVSILHCFNGSGWCWWCNVWGIISWHTLGPLVPTEHRLNTTAYWGIVADHVHPFMTRVYPSCDGYVQQDKAQIISNCSLEHKEFTILKWPLQWVIRSPALCWIYATKN